MPAASVFEYAVVRVVPRVEREEFLNAGVVLCCLEQRFLAARLALERARLAVFAPWLSADDLDAVQQHLDLIALVCAGAAEAGEIGGLPLARRFDWLVTPRSTLVQTSPVHAGLCRDPRAELERLFDLSVRLPPEDGRCAPPSHPRDADARPPRSA
ncbi:MAG TPA: DUF3037 domain-containing protein [Dehalococcoidia bacterium]|nr:DUF3037 domain-containing protein [Dehalococcoidia bacterium]